MKRRPLSNIPQPGYVGLRSVGLYDFSHGLHQPSSTSAATVRSALRPQTVARFLRRKGSAPPVAQAHSRPTTLLQAARWRPELEQVEAELPLLEPSLSSPSAAPLGMQRQVVLQDSRQSMDLSVEAVIAANASITSRSSAESGADAFPVSQHTSERAGLFAGGDERTTGRQALNERAID